MKEKINAELSRRKRSAEEKIKMLWTEKNAKRSSSAVVVPYLLLVLDDEGYKTSEYKVMKDLGLESFLKHDLGLKLLITRREDDGIEH